MFINILLFYIYNEIYTLYDKYTLDISIIEIRIGY